MLRKNYALAVNLRHHLHQYPELSACEVETKNLLMEFLRKHTNLELVDKAKYFYAIKRTAQIAPNIAFRAEMDALPIDETIDLPYASNNPGIAHKCGHDGHAAALAAFALEINQLNLDKNVFLLFQHAEETGEGAKEAASFIKENAIDEIYTFHNMSALPYKSIAIKNQVIFSPSKGMIIKFKGKAAHASMPEKGRNPAFAIATLVKMIEDLNLKKSAEDSYMCTIVGIDLGEKTFGKSPAEGQLFLTIRAASEAELDKLEKEIIKSAKQEANNYSLKFDIGYADIFPQTYNHKIPSEKVRKAAKLENLQLIELEKPVRSSEDFAYYSKLCPAALFLIGNGEEYPAIHTQEYDFRDEIIQIANDIFMQLVKMPLT